MEHIPTYTYAAAYSHRLAEEHQAIAIQENSCLPYLYHWIMGNIEALPIVGVIVAFCEVFFANCCCYYREPKPDPTPPPIDEILPPPPSPPPAVAPLPPPAAVIPIIPPLTSLIPQKYGDPSIFRTNIPLPSAILPIIGEFVIGELKCSKDAYTKTYFYISAFSIHTLYLRGQDNDIVTVVNELSKTSHSIRQFHVEMYANASFHFQPAMDVFSKVNLNNRFVKPIRLTLDYSLPNDDGGILDLMESYPPLELSRMVDVSFTISLRVLQKHFAYFDAFPEIHHLDLKIGDDTISDKEIAFILRAKKLTFSGSSIMDEGPINYASFKNIPLFPNLTKVEDFLCNQLAQDSNLLTPTIDELSVYSVFNKDIHLLVQKCPNLTSLTIKCGLKITDFSHLASLKLKHLNFHFIPTNGLVSLKQYLDAHPSPPKVKIQFIHPSQEIRELVQEIRKLVKKIQKRQW